MGVDLARIASHFSWILRRTLGIHLRTGNIAVQQTDFQGNAAFGPLPIELDPETLAEAGGDSIIQPVNTAAGFNHHDPEAFTSDAGIGLGISTRRRTSRPHHTGIINGTGIASSSSRRSPEKLGGSVEGDENERSVEEEIGDGEETMEIEED